MPTCTDNRWNGAALDKRSARATRITQEGLVTELQVEWTPRSSNQQADELANGVTSRFSEDLRVGTRREDLKWQLLPEALRFGREAEDMYIHAKKSGALPNRCIRQKRKRSDERMRMTDPW